MTVAVTSDQRRSSSADVEVLEGDLDASGFARALAAGVLAWDSETTGLDWRVDRIATVQLGISPDLVVVVRLNDQAPHRLSALLEDRSIAKVMHHAMFDLRFLVSHWQSVPRNVACTKIAAKLLRPGADPGEHTLAALVERYFGVTLDKSVRRSDWTRDTLDAAQLRYAADDVRYLVPLYEALDHEIRRSGLLSLQDRCYAHLMTRVELELGDYPDVFAYQ